MKTRRFPLLLLVVLALTVSPCNVMSAEPQESDDFTETVTGPLQDVLASVAPYAVFYVDAEGERLSCDLSHSSSQTEFASADDFFNAILWVLGSKEYRDDKRDIDFMALTDTALRYVSISHFKSLANFSSSLINTPIGETDPESDSVDALYRKFFYNHDAGLSSSQEKKPEDDLWIFSSFRPGAEVKTENSTCTIHYRRTGDKRQYGYDTRYDAQRAAENLSSYMSRDPSLISLNKVEVACYEGDTGNELCTITLTRTGDSAWESDPVVSDLEFVDGYLKAGDEIEN